ncbi:hypothetical protein C0J52_03486 [Blattella germanica]|nr:hypothetical protein C0J52_03486 [Blattella germanica]
MSNLIPPMVSSSPPPMDDTMEEDEDDEFGDFTVADDVDVSPTPVVLPSISSTFWGEEECQIKQNGICNGSAIEDDDESDRKEVERIVVGQDNTSQDSVVSGTTDSGLCSASQNSEGASPSPVAGSSPSPVGLDREESSGSDETLVKSVDIDGRVFGDAQTETVTEESIASSDNFDNFSDFQSVSEVVRTDSHSEVSKHLTEEVDEFGDFESVPVPQDDDFDDFESAENMESDHDFFKYELVNRLQTIVDSLFPLSTATLLDVNVPQLDERLAALWIKLKDVEASHALSYQWSGSSSNKSLLMSLGIDSPTEMPTNDALVQGILATPKPELSTSNELVQRILASSQTTPAPRSRQGLSAEAVKVLDDLPELSFLQAKLLMFPVRGTSP